MTQQRAMQVKTYLFIVITSERYLLYSQVLEEGGMAQQGMEGPRRLSAQGAGSNQTGGRGEPRADAFMGSGAHRQRV